MPVDGALLWGRGCGDSRGYTQKAYASYYTDGAPSKTLVKGADNQVPSAAENVYDGMGRVTDVLTDQQGTSMAAVAMTSLAVTRRKQLPFGQLRSEQTDNIPGARGFIGGTDDPTDLGSVSLVSDGSR